MRKYRTFEHVKKGVFGMKNNLKRKVISFVLCSILLLGSVMIVQADPPICGGNHSYSTVGGAGIDIVWRGMHNHDGRYLCGKYIYYNRYLQRCLCGAGTVWVDTSSPQEHHERIILEWVSFPC